MMTGVALDLAITGKEREKKKKQGLHKKRNQDEQTYLPVRLPQDFAITA